MKTTHLEKDNYTPALLRYEIVTVLKTDQQKLAEKLKVSTAAISRAINGDLALKLLRERIIRKIHQRKKAA